jgi:hypothetical protein
MTCRAPPLFASKGAAKWPRNFMRSHLSGAVYLQLSESLIAVISDSGSAILFLKRPAVRGARDIAQ